MLYTNDDIPEYETVEPIQKRRNVMYTKRQEQRYFQLEHRLSDIPGVIKLVLQDPITLDANTAYAALALQNITYMERWNNIVRDVVACEVSLFDSLIAADQLSPSDFVVLHRLRLTPFHHLHSSQDIMQLLKTTLSRPVAVPYSFAHDVLFDADFGDSDDDGDDETTDDDRDYVIDVKDYIKIDYIKNMLSIANIHSRVAVKVTFNVGFQETCG